MASSTPFLSAISHRRSIYNITPDLPIPSSKLHSILSTALLETPSPFNVRSTRIILLRGTHHAALWREAHSIIARDSPAALPILGPKIEGFVKGAGTVLFFDDETTYEKLTPRYQALSRQFPEWEDHSSGMCQFVVWTALDAEGCGCSLQHYQPAITDFVRQRFDVPASWKLKCQLVFGGLEDGVERPLPKEKTDLQVALRVFGDE